MTDSLGLIGQGSGIIPPRKLTGAGGAEPPGGGKDFKQVMKDQLKELKNRSLELKSETENIVPGGPVDVEKLTGIAEKQVDTEQLLLELRKSMTTTFK